MSNARIRTLLNDKLFEGLYDPNTEMLKWPIYPKGTEPDNEDGIPFDTHLVVSLIPSPVLNGTLGGDHRGYTGIYQITINASNGLGSTPDPYDDLNLVVDKVVEALEEVFHVDMRLGTEGEFVVQLMTSISVSNGNREKGDSGLEAHAYFSYRADTN